MGLFSKGLSQKDKYLIQARSACDTLEFHKKELENPNTDIVTCANITDGILLIFESLYEILPYIKDEFEIEPDNFEDFKQIYLNNLKTIVEERKKEILDKYKKTGQLRYYSQLVNLNDDIKKAKKIFYAFKDYLINDDLEKIISEGEK